MSELIKDIIVAIGGGSIALIGLLTIFKQLFLKFLETSIDSTFEKKVEKYRNQLSRSSRAYEMILDREMQYYQKMEPIIAEMVPLIHDLKYCMEKGEKSEYIKKCEYFKECFGRYADMFKEIRNETLIHQAYIPKDVLVSSTAIVKIIHDDSIRWAEFGKSLFDEKYEDIDYRIVDEMLDSTLKAIAILSVTIKTRLESLSSI